MKVEAKNIGQNYNLPVTLGKFYITAKFDTGAGHTVISAQVFTDNWNEETAKIIEKKLDDRKIKKREFITASGDKILGYKICSKDVMIGDVMIPVFKYYFITRSKRAVALLGKDYIDCCGFYHKPHKSIILEEFDEDVYSKKENDSIEEDELIEILDEVV